MCSQFFTVSFFFLLGRGLTVGRPSPTRFLKCRLENFLARLLREDPSGSGMHVYSLSPLTPSCNSRMDVQPSRPRRADPPTYVYGMRLDRGSTQQRSRACCGRICAEATSLNLPLFSTRAFDLGGVGAGCQAGDLQPAALCYSPPERVLIDMKKKETNVSSRPYFAMRREGDTSFF